MKKANSRLLLIAVMLLSILSGCWDSREIDDEVYAIAIGVDKGVKNKVRLTIQYPTYQSRPGGEGGQSGGGDMASPNQQPTSNIHTMECPTILEGIDMMGMAISRKVSLMHAKMMVFSEEFAREGVGSYVAPIERYRETRSTMAVVVSTGTAEEFLKENKSNIGGTISKAVELMFLQARYSNYFPYIQFKNFYRDMLSPYQQPVAIYGGVNDFKQMAQEKVENPPLNVREGFLPGKLPRRGVAKREYTGVAVFDGGKMVGALDSYETTYFLMLSGNFPAGAVTFEDPQEPGKAIVTDMRIGRKPKVKSYFKDGKPVVDVRLVMEVDIESIQSRINYEKKEMLDKLNQYMKQELLIGMEGLIHKTQKELKSDIFGFGRYMAGNFNTIPEFSEYDWLSHYPEAKINLDLEVETRRSGLLTNSASIQDGHKEKH